MRCKERICRSERIRWMLRSSGSAWLRFGQSLWKLSKRKELCQRVSGNRSGEILPFTFFSAAICCYAVHRLTRRESDNLMGVRSDHVWVSALAFWKPLKRWGKELCGSLHWKRKLGVMPEAKTSLLPVHWRNSYSCLTEGFWKKGNEVLRNQFIWLGTHQKNPILFFDNWITGRFTVSSTRNFIDTTFRSYQFDSRKPAGLLKF